MAIYHKYHEWYTRIALVVCGLIIAVPGIVGALSPIAITSLYKTGALTDIEAVLLQHRGILLAIVGLLLLASVHLQHLRITAILAALVSNTCFILYVLLYPATAAALGAIAGVDAVLSVLLLVALIIHTKYKV